PTALQLAPSPTRRSSDLAVANAEALAERRRAELEAEQARLDPLTRLANRRAYQEAIEEQPAASAAVVVDLDHFKRVNDTFGHNRSEEHTSELQSRFDLVC